MAVLASDWWRHIRCDTYYIVAQQFKSSQDERPGLLLAETFWLLWNHWMEFSETWRQQYFNILYQVCVFWDDWKTKILAETFSTIHLKLLNWIQRNLTGIKISTSSTKFAVFSSTEPKAQVSYCHSASSVRPSSSVNFHIFDFLSRTAWWILMKLGRDEVLMVPYKCCCFSARSAQGWIQGGAKIGHGGSPSLRNFFFRPEGYREKLNA